MDVFGYLGTCKYRYHLDAADFWNGLLGPDEKVYLQEGFLKKVKEALAEREMCLANYHADGCHAWEDNPDARERNHQSALSPPGRHGSSVHRRCGLTPAGKGTSG